MSPRGNPDFWRIFSTNETPAMRLLGREGAVKIFSACLLVLGAMILAYWITEVLIDVLFREEVFPIKTYDLVDAITLGVGMIMTAIVIRRWR
jgi:hypothetical protein